MPEDEDTTLHFNGQCSALRLLWKNIIGDYTLQLDDLIHLKFAKTSKRVYRPWCHWVSALASVLAAGWLFITGIHSYRTFTWKNLP